MNSLNRETTIANRLPAALRFPSIAFRRGFAGELADTSSLALIFL